MSKAEIQLEKESSIVPLELTSEMPGELQRRYQFDKGEYEQDLATLRLLKEKERKLRIDDIEVPPILLVANKCEDEFDVNPIYD